MAYNEQLSQVNDRVTRLAARLAAVDGGGEEPLHPSVAEAEVSAAVVAHGFGELPRTRAGRGAIRERFQLVGSLSEAQAQELLARVQVARVLEDGVPSLDELAATVRRQGEQLASLRSHFESISAAAESQETARPAPVTSRSTSRG